jgi:septal ring factor EnvC (AmiA/AmiB activator)
MQPFMANGAVVPLASNPNGGIGSAVAPPNWDGMPRLESPIADLSTGQVTIPWYNFMIFLCSRAAIANQQASDITTLQGQVTTLQGQVTTLQGQVTTLQDQMTTANDNISTLQGQMSTLLNTTIPNLQNEDTNLQNQINAINQRLTNAGIP